MGGGKQDPTSADCVLEIRQKEQSFLESGPAKANEIALILSKLKLNSKDPSKESVPVILAAIHSLRRIFVHLFHENQISKKSIDKLRQQNELSPENPKKKKQKHDGQKEKTATEKYTQWLEEQYIKYVDKLGEVVLPHDSQALPLGYLVLRRRLDSPEEAERKRREAEEAERRARLLLAEAEGKKQAANSAEGDARALRAIRDAPGCERLREKWPGDDDDGGSDVSGWEGVTVDGKSGRVVKLDLERNGLTSVPSELGELTALRWLLLNNNPGLKGRPLPPAVEALRERGCSIYR